MNNAENSFFFKFWADLKTIYWITRKYTNMWATKRSILLVNFIYSQYLCCHKWMIFLKMFIATLTVYWTKNNLKYISCFILIYSFISIKIAYHQRASAYILYIFNIFRRLDGWVTSKVYITRNFFIVMLYSTYNIVVAATRM